MCELLIFSMGSFFPTIIIVLLTYSQYIVYEVSTTNQQLSTKLEPMTLNQFNNVLLTHSELGKELVKELQKYAPHYPFPASHVRQALSNAAQELGVPNPEDDTCDRDFKSLCPLDWFPRGDGSHCLPSLNYNGSCNKETNFSELTPLQKAKFATQCKAPWSCKSSGCNQDFTKPCPEEFTIQEDGSCIASSSYSGGCVRNVSFKRLSIANRMLWAKKCNVNWPCYTSCIPNQTSVCPQRWTLSHSKQTCIAPLDYLGPCSPVQPVSLAKEIMIKECQCTYACQMTSKRIQSMPQCELDYEKPCPVGWKLLDTTKALCVAPSSYEGKCSWRFSFFNYTSAMKLAFSTACKVTWPCLISSTTSQIHDHNNLLPKKGAEFIPHTNDGLSDLGIIPTIVSLENQSTHNEETKKWDKANTTEDYASLRNRRHQMFLKQFLLYAKNRVPSTIQDAIKSAEQSLKTRKNDAIFEFHIQNNGPDKIESHSLTHPFAFISISSNSHLKNNLNQSKGFKKPFDLYDVSSNPHKNKVITPQRFLKGNGMRNIFKQLNKNGYLQRITDNLNARIDSYGGHINNEIYPSPNTQCVRDYTIMCPVGWVPLTHSNLTKEGKNIMCKADTSVQNTLACDTIQPFGSMTPQEKQIAERTCGIIWPCRHCVHDYIRSFCPQGWLYEGNGYCRKSPWITEEEKFLSGIETKSWWCSNRVNFKYMVPELRRLWGKVCGYDWPCFQDCEQDFSSPCPQHWLEVKKKKGSTLPYSTCVPSKNLLSRHKGLYSFPCGKLLKVSLSIMGRYTLQTSCNVQWPCRDLCEMDFSQPCPYGFSYNSKIKQCTPSTYATRTNQQSELSQTTVYDGFCSRIPSFSSLLGIRQKKLYSSNCHALWPCKNFCEQDFSHPCPKKWKEKKLKERLLCIPNKSYNGPCNDAHYDVTFFSEVSKWELAWKCQVIQTETNSLSINLTTPLPQSKCYLP